MFGSLQKCMLGALVLSALLPATALADANPVPQDSTPPVLKASAVNVPRSGWFNGSSPICISVTAADTGSGVAKIDLMNSQGLTLADLTSTQRSQPTLTGYLCTTAPNLAQGTQKLDVVAVDLTGNYVDVPVSLSVDTQAPSVSSQGATPAPGPFPGYTDVYVILNPDVSGIATAWATLDGRTPLPPGWQGVNPAVFEYALKLSPGRHTVNWTAIDNAGIASSGSFSFTTPS